MIRYSGPCLVLVAHLSLCAQAPAAAQEVDPYALSPEQLFEAEVISASRTLESVWEAPAAVHVITAADIERAGADSIAEALRLAPGVNVARINSSGWAVSVRGFNSALANKLLVLMDGRESYDPLFSGVYWDVQDTAIEDIERIEVVRGPGGSLWGANAVNGVINIITRPAAETQGGLVSAFAGEEGAGLTARYGAAAGIAHWRIYGRAFDREPQEALAGGGDNSGWEALRGGFRADIAHGPGGGDVTVQGDLYHSETGQRRVISSLSAPFASLVQEEIVAEGANLLARWTRESASGGRIVAQGYVDLTRRRQALLEDRRTTFDVDLQYEPPRLGAHELVAGVRYRHTHDEVTETESISTQSGSPESGLLSVFVQDRIALGRDWRLTLGSKFDDNHYTGFEAQPSARLQWLGQGQTLWAAASRAVRAPSELEREYNILFAAGPPIAPLTVPTSVELLASPEFESEEVEAYEIGYRRQWTPALDMDVALFRNEYDGLATLSASAPMLADDPPRFILIPIMITNATSAQTHGAEILFDWRPHERVGVTASYSHLDMELAGPAAAIDAEAAEGQSPRNQAYVRVGWRAGERISLDGAVYYVDNLPAYAIDAYTRFDLRAAWRINEVVQFELVGRNLFDDVHREFGAPGDANAAQIQRSVLGRLTWRR